MSTESDMTMSRIDVLYLAPHLPSLTYRAYTHRVEGFCLIDWLLDRLRSRAGRRQLLVLCHDRLEGERVRVYADRLGIPVLPASGNTRLQALSDLAMAVPGAQVACFRPELALAPSRLLDEVWAHHVSNSNQYTRVSGVPFPIGIEIFDSGLLAALGRIEYPGIPPEITQVVERLAEMRNQPGGPGLRATPYRSGSPLIEPDADLAVETAVDVRRARAALQDLGDPYEWEAIARWQAATVDFPPPAFSLARKPDFHAALYVSAWSGYSGAEECLRALVDGMNRRGWQQYAVVGADGLLAERMRMVGADVFCPNWRFNTDTAEGDRFASQLFDGLQVEVAHCNSDPGMPIIREARRRGIPLATHIRVASFERFGHSVQESDHLITVSNFVKRRLIAAGIPEDRVTVVYDGVDTVRFSPERRDRDRGRREFGLPADAFVVLLVARLSENKRHDLLLEAAALAMQDVPNLHLVFVGRHGNAVLEKDIANRTRALRLEERLQWLPFQEDIRPVESAADVIVLCSDEEPLGTCVLEGMGLGVPVVVNSSSGTHELIEPEVSGLAVPGGDAAALASALRRLGTDPPLGARLATAARQRAERLFSIEKHAADVASVFERLRISR
jgi:glycosyltransferase involved in cell wall biosynthesis